MEQLKSLYGVLGMFDPVYNTYFDNSYDDVTDDMVSYRKAKNSELKKIIKEIAIQHKHFLTLAQNEDMNRGIHLISEWVLNISKVYCQYLSMYRYDEQLPENENYLRKAPLLKLESIIAFSESLKQLIFHLNPNSNTATSNSNFETSVHHLRKLTQQFREMKPDLELISGECLDICSLRAISVTLSKEILDFNSGFQCKMFYFHKSQTVSMNFEKVQIVPVNDCKVDQIVLLEVDSTNHSKVLFAPIKRNEMNFVQMVDQNTIQFDHYSKDVQLFFTVDENTRMGVLDELKEFFPSKKRSVYQTRSTGLGVKNPLFIRPEAAQDYLSTSEESGSASSELSFVPASQLTKSSSRVDLSIRENGTKLAEKFMKDIIESTVSDEDSDVDCDVEMDEEIQEAEAMSIISMDSLPQKESVRLVQINNTHIQQLTSLPQPPALTNKGSNSSMSSTSTDTSKSKKFMGKLTGMFRRDNSSNASLILENSSSLKLNKSSSNSSLNSKQDMRDLVKDATTFQLPSSKVSYWRNNSWTNTEVQHLKLHNLPNAKYIGVYSVNEGSLNMLVKIIPRSSCQKHALDLQFSTMTHDNKPIVVLFRTSNEQKLSILESAIQDYEFSSISQSSSTQSNLMDQSITQSSSLQTMAGHEHEGKPQYWNGMASLTIIKGGKMKKSDRCVVSACNRNGEVEVELTGYEFGRLTVQSNAEQVSMVKDNRGQQRVLVADKVGKYVLGFDDQDLMSKFYQCVSSRK